MARRSWILLVPTNASIGPTSEKYCGEVRSNLQLVEGLDVAQSAGEHRLEARLIRHEDASVEREEVEERIEARVATAGGARWTNLDKSPLSPISLL